MNYSRRRFVGQCAAVVGTSAVSAMIGRTPADAAQTEPLRNWAGNYRYSTNRITSATSLAQIQEFVRKHAHFKVLGTRHCFNGIADSADEFLSLREMNDSRRARSRGADGHGGVGNELRPTVPVSRSGRLRAPQSGLTAAHLDRRRLRHRHARLGCEERQPLDGGVGIRDRDGRAATSCRSRAARTSARFRRRSSIWAPLAWSPRSRWMCSRRSRCGRTCTWTCRWRRSGSISKTSSLPATASACSPIGSGDGSTKSG